VLYLLLYAATFLITPYNRTEVDYSSVALSTIDYNTKQQYSTETHRVSNEKSLDCAYSRTPIYSIRLI